MQAVWQHAKQSGGALVLLLAIADNAHDDGDSAYPSIGTLAKKARMTERNVNILLKQLVLAGEISIRHGEGPRGTNVYRVNLHDQPTPENISPPKTFHPEKSDTRGVKNPVRGGEASFRGGVKPISPKPSVNRQREPSVEPSERVRALPRLTLETYHPDSALLEGLGAERPDLNLPAVIDNWRDYHRERGTAIKDFNASLRRWVRQEKPPPRASPNGQRESTAQARERRTLEAIWGKQHGQADLQPEPIEARYSVVGRADPGAD